jgi:hypothetical protein
MTGLIRRKTEFSILSIENSIIKPLPYEGALSGIIAKSKNKHTHISRADTKNINLPTKRKEMKGQ